MRQEPYFFSSLGAEPFYFRPPTQRVIEVKQEAPTAPPAPVPQMVLQSPDVVTPKPEPAPVVAAPTKPQRPPVVAAAPAATSAVKQEVSTNVAKATEKRKPSLRDSICISIIERSQVGEPISPAERIYLRECAK